MKYFTLIALLGLFLQPGFTQIDNVSLAECYTWAEQADPIIGNVPILGAISGLEQENLDARRMPNLSLSGQASYQSDVVKLPIESPMLAVPALPNERFQLALDGAYVLYDGGLIDALKERESAQLRQKQQDLDVQLYGLRSQVDRFYFGALQARQEQKLLQTAREDLQERIEQVKAAARYGIATAGDVDRLRVRVLELENQQEQAVARERSALLSLEALVDTVFAEAVTLALPDFDPALQQASLGRPELELFALQRQLILANEAVLSASRQPTVSLFLQTGLGYPNPLNFFDDSFSPFAMGGVRAQWTITDWKQTERKRQQLALQADLVQRQEASFRRKATLGEQAYQERIRQLLDQRQRQEHIRELREQVLEESRLRLDKGLITSTDYVQDLNALLQADLNLETIQLQIIREQVQYRTNYGLTAE